MLLHNDFNHKKVRSLNPLRITNKLCQITLNHLNFTLYSTVNEHYKGNRFRNQVVRQDFPTALNEQNKEKENAERQAALYHQMINEQEEADAKVARELSDRLRGDMEKERRRQIDSGEHLAKRLHEKMLIQKKPPMPPPEPMANELPIPPKNASSKFVGGHVAPHRPAMVDQTDGAGPSSFSKPHMQQHVNAQLNYVSLELNAPRQNPPRAVNHHQTQYTQVMPQLPNYSSPSPTGTLASSDGHHYERINLHSHTPEKKTNPAAFHDFNMPSTSNGVSVSPPRPVKTQSLASNVPDQYKLPTLPPKQQLFQRQNERDAVKKLSTEAFDYLMGNRATISDAAAEEIDLFGASMNAAREQQSYSPTRRERYQASLSNVLGSANDIESYPEEEAQGAQGTVAVGNSERIRTLQELGVPVDEILEIDRRITQQEKDEELARQLQAQERKTLTQEEKDHLVAMEAQDKELARMLQERVCTTILTSLYKHHDLISLRSMSNTYYFLVYFK